MPQKLAPPDARIGPRTPGTRDVPIQRDDPFSSPDLLQSVLNDLADPGNADGGASLAGGITHKVGKAVTDPDTLMQLHRLLGVPLQWGKRGFLQLSSVDPQAGLARLFSLDASGAPGERVAMALTDLVKALKTGAIEETAGDLPKRVVTAFDDVDRAVGERVPQLTATGPKGGAITKRRAVPTVATR